MFDRCGIKNYLLTYGSVFVSQSTEKM